MNGVACTRIRGRWESAALVLLSGRTHMGAAGVSLVSAVRLAGTHGFVVDLCVRSQQIPEATWLVERSPEVTFVLDHLGKPDIGSG
jgi:predicted TIM-barrel fold metal-dependent hydrolase